MNQSSFDEYEDVESPYAPKTSVKAKPQRERLRTRKNVFNRPFATDSSTPPTYFETTATRRALDHHQDAELIEHRESELSQTQIEYLDEEEDEVVEKKPSSRSSSSTKKIAKVRSQLLRKIAWSIVGLLVLRLICMDRGVWDYFSTEAVIRDKQDELSSIQKENKELRTEITRIQVDKGYQKQLAKEHLGVIAVDEFLILFAGETPDEVAQNPNEI